MDADRFLQTLMDAVAVGSLYALIALGYTMVYGILKFINFAHSDVFVLGAWISLVAAAVVGLTPGAERHIAPWVVYVLVAVTAGAGLACLYEYILHPRLGVLRARLPRTGAGLVLTVAAGWGWGAVALLYAARGVNHAGFATVSGGMILVLAMATCGLVGFCLERLAYKPLRRAPRLNVLITAIGVSLFLQNVGQTDWMFGTRPDRMPTLLPDVVLNRTTIHRGTVALDGEGRLTAAHAADLADRRLYRVVVGTGEGSRTYVVRNPPGPVARGEALSLAPPPGPEAAGQEYALVRDPGVPIRLVDLTVFVTALALMIGLNWLVFGTKIGRAMRAVSFSPSNASLMGINVDRVISFTFVLGSTLAAAAGFLMGQKYPGLNQTAAAGWVLLGLKAFVAAVIGGIGNIRGAMLGGLLIGLLEFFAVQYFPDGASLRDIFVFGALILVLLFKPSGVLGKAVAEKV